MKSKKIGVIDSGVGGLTVVKKLRKEFPNEDMLFLGDNINVPYGNKTKKELYNLSKALIDYLTEEREVKLIGVACNTISAIVEEYFKDYKVPVVSIIGPVSNYVARSGIEDVGILGTVFTVNSGAYNEKIGEVDPAIKIVSEGSLNLAEMIDRDDYSEEEIGEVVDLHLNNIREKNKNIEDIILACTHYPIILDKFKEKGPEINFIDPADEQVRHIRGLLKERDILNNQTSRGRLDLLTTGEKEVYEKTTKKMNIDYDSINKIILK